jgi:hypothetical protein
MAGLAGGGGQERAGVGPGQEGGHAHPGEDGAADAVAMPARMRMGITLVPNSGATMQSAPQRMSTSRKPASIG